MNGVVQLLCALSLATPVLARAEGEQQFAELGDLKLTSGQTLQDCRVGYRTFGKLNAAKSNAVLVTTWYLGKSEDFMHSFEPGGLIDKSKYFIVVVDALGNAISSSPSNSKSQPEGKFPAVSIRDMVESQHSLLLKLGIDHLRAITGISMGGVQTFQWVTAYPDFVDKAIPIVGSPRPTSYDLMYYGSGLKALNNAIANPAARKPIITAFADYFWLALRTPAYYAHHTDRATAVSGMDGFENAILAWDPYDAKLGLQALADNDAFKPFGDDEAKAALSVKAKLLVISATQDHSVNPAPALSFAKALGAKVLLLSGDSGHQSPGESMSQISPAVAELLDQN